MRKILCLVAVSLGASGCTTFEPLRPDMEARPLPSRADEVAFINGLREAFVDAASTSQEAVPCYTGTGLKPFRPKYVQGYSDWDAEQEALGTSGQCLKFRSDPSDGDIRRYIENGFGLTDLYCQRFFTIATETRQSRRLQRGLFATGNELLNAILAALSGSKNALAISSAGFSAVNSSYDKVDEAFLVAPSRDDVRSLVHGAQQLYRASAFTSENMPQSYPSARSVVERYAGMCTFDGMRQLVSDSVAGETAKLNEAAERQRIEARGMIGAPAGGVVGRSQSSNKKPPAEPPIPEGGATPTSVPVPVTPGR